MTILREAAQMALDALDSDSPDIQLRAATTLRARLTQREEKPEPVAWDVFVKHSYIYFSIGNQSFQLAMAPEDEPDMSAGQIAAWYMTQLRNALARLASTLPPQRPWQGLTDEEINTIAATPAAIPGSYVHSFARAIEAKLKEKNNK